MMSSGIIHLIQSNRKRTKSRPLFYGTEQTFSLSTYDKNGCHKSKNRDLFSWASRSMHVYRITHP